MGWVLAIPALGPMHREKVHQARAPCGGPNDPYAHS